MPLLPVAANRLGLNGPVPRKGHLRVVATSVIVLDQGEALALGQPAECCFGPGEPCIIDARPWKGHLRVPGGATGATGAISSVG